MKKTVLATALVAGWALSGCYRGYKSADELASDDRGPGACAKSCKELGMQMSAFVLVERQTSGCVCSPIAAPVQAGPVAAAAGAHVVLEQQRQAAEEHAATQQPAPSGF